MLIKHVEYGLYLLITELLIKPARQVAYFQFPANGLPPGFLVQTEGLLRKVIIRKCLFKRINRFIGAYQTVVYAAAAALRKAKVDLEKTRITVTADEQKNLKRAAAIYDKMDPESAAKIVEDMCDNGQEEDAAKILHYMQERSVAKLLAAIADKKKVARLNELMKRIHDEATVS